MGFGGRVNMSNCIRYVTNAAEDAGRKGKLKQSRRYLHPGIVESMEMTSTGALKAGDEMIIYVWETDDKHLFCEIEVKNVVVFNFNLIFIDTSSV